MNDFYALAFFKTSILQKTTTKRSCVKMSSVSEVYKDLTIDVSGPVDNYSFRLNFNCNRI